MKERERGGRRKIEKESERERVRERALKDLGLCEKLNNCSHPGREWRLSFRPPGNDGRIQ